MGAVLSLRSSLYLEGLAFAFGDCEAARRVLLNNFCFGICHLMFFALIAIGSCRNDFLLGISPSLRKCLLVFCVNDSNSLLIIGRDLLYDVFGLLLNFLVEQ